MLHRRWLRPWGTLGVVVDSEQPENVGQVHLRAAPVIIPGLRVGLHAPLAPVVALREQAGDGEHGEAARHRNISDPALLRRRHNPCLGGQAAVDEVRHARLVGEEPVVPPVSHVVEWVQSVVLSKSQQVERTIP